MSDIRRFLGSRRSFWALTLAALFVVALTLRLSLWQFDRAEQKRALEIAAQTSLAADAVTLFALSSAQSSQQSSQPTLFQRADVVGRYSEENQLLLENRVRNKRAGYYVITPFELAGGGVALVNRGWLAGDGTRNAPPIPAPPAGRVTVSGVFYSDNAAAYRLSDAPETGHVRQNLRIAAYAAQTGLALASLVLIRQGDDATLPAADIIRADYKSRQSVIYAWQWLSFCLLAIVFYVLLARKMRR